MSNLRADFRLLTGALLVLATSWVHAGDWRAKVDPRIDAVLRAKSDSPVQVLIEPVRRCARIVRIVGARAAPLTHL